MIPRGKDLRKLWFEWPESLYGRFNFQRDEHIDTLVEHLMDENLPAVVVLGGERGIGRGFLCETAAQRAREQGHKVAVWHLDLDGFEPDVENPLTRYLRHLIDQQERQLEAVRDKAKGVVKSAAKTLSQLHLVGQASEVAASLLSLLWQFEDPLTHFAELLSQPPNGGGTPPRNDPETLHRFLTELTRDRKLLVHVRDGAQLTSNLRRWLIREAERAPERLLLVISCALEQATEQAAPEARATPERLDVLPLDTAELRNLLDRRFDPNKLPNDLVEVLMRLWHGRPAAIANQLADLMEAELLFCEDETWRLPPAGLKDPRLVDAFSRGLFEEIDKHLAALAEEEPDLARVLGELLPLAALCGRYVPMAALLNYLSLDEDMTEAVVDWVDNVLVDELGWLADLEFNLVGFPGYNVYAFTHPLLPLVILDQEPQMAREQQAVGLLRFLEQRVHVTRRGWARCFLSIAEYLGDREREVYERSLAWWSGLEAAEALQTEVRTAIEHGEIEPELVWQVANSSKVWPAYRRLALLEAYTQAMVSEEEGEMAVMPFGRLADFHLLRAEMLLYVGRYAEALTDVLRIQKLVSKDLMKQFRVLYLSGMAKRRLGDFGGAKIDLERALELGRDDLVGESSVILSELARTNYDLGDCVRAKEFQEEALEIAERVFGGEHTNTLIMRNELAEIVHVQGDFVGARNLREEILRITEHVLGDENRATLVVRHGMARDLHALDDFVGARKLHEENIKIAERVLGPEHPDTLGMRNNLAGVLSDLGDFSGAKRLQEEVLESAERVLTAEHPDVLVVREGLGKTLHALGDFAGARKLQEEVLESRERMLGGKHPNTTDSTWDLLMTIRELNDPDAEANLIHQLRWLLDCDEDSIPSFHQRKVRLGLLDLINPPAP